MELENDWFTTILNHFNISIMFIIIECVFKAHQETSEQMVKKATSNMLRAAPDRRGGGGRPLRAGEEALGDI